MDEQRILEQVAETGRMLLENGLVTRTWGNFSARLDKTHFAITPSGLGYEHMHEDDIVRCCLNDSTYEGTRKPSSEKGIHSEAYRIFPETGFVIHTHQVYATALGLTAPDNLRLTQEEKDTLGKVAFAEYGLPGTEKLKQNVAQAFETGAHTVLMKHHGAVICGANREEALHRALLLEDVCRRSCRCDDPAPGVEDRSALIFRIRKTFPAADLEEGNASRAWSALRLPLWSQLDDVAQMIGAVIPFSKDEHELMKLLKHHATVFVPGAGVVVRGDNVSDTEALKLLTDKAAIAALHTHALHVRADLSLPDCVLMRLVYKLKYAKKKEG